MATTKVRDKTDKKSAPSARRKTETIVCPHCGEDFDVTENGRYICPECENYVDVDLFDTPHVHQPDGDTCGWATTKWLLSAFGCKVPSDKQLLKELHVKKGTEGISGAIVQGFNSLVQTIGKRWKWQGIDVNGTLPPALIATLMRHGLKPVFPGFGGLVAYSDYKEYMEDVFSRDGRFALFYVKPEYAHWIGIDKFNGKKRVMDPMDFDYSPFSKNEALRSKRVRVCCMIGFVRA